MRLQRFEVQGYKNLRQRLILDELGAINVIHGENNVGKSNLLQAIGLFFRVLRHVSEEELTIRLDAPWRRPVNEWDALGFPAAEIFNLETPSRLPPIELAARVALADDEARELGLADVNHLVDLQIRISREFDMIEVHGPLPHFGQNTAFSPDLDEVAKRLVTFLSRRHLPRIKQTVERFALLGTDRRLREEKGDDSRDLVPSGLLLQLYDAKESIEPERYRRWELFAENMTRFSDIMGPGSFMPLYDRQAARANLAWQTQHARILVGFLGSGVQQLVAIVLRLLMSDATIVAIEEPELNLRFTLQRRLYELFEDITGAEAGPRQLFVTSHSPAFEPGGFYGMRATPDGPVIERRPAAEAPIFTGHAVGDATEAYLHGRDAVLSYVSSDGTVQLPRWVRTELGIEGGGGIVVWKRSDQPYVELLTNEQFLADMREHATAPEEEGASDDRD